MDKLWTGSSCISLTTLAFHLLWLELFCAENDQTFIYMCKARKYITLQLAPVIAEIGNCVDVKTGRNSIKTQTTRLDFRFIKTHKPHVYFPLLFKIMFYWCVIVLGCLDFIRVCILIISFIPYLVCLSLCKSNCAVFPWLPLCVPSSSKSSSVWTFIKPQCDYQALVRSSNRLTKHDTVLIEAQ